FLLTLECSVYILSPGSGDGKIICGLAPVRGGSSAGKSRSIGSALSVSKAGAVYRAGLTRRGRSCPVKGEVREALARGQSRRPGGHLLRNWRLLRTGGGAAFLKLEADIAVEHYPVVHQIGRW